MPPGDIRNRAEELLEVGDVLRGPGWGDFTTICEVGSEHIAVDSLHGPVPVVLNYDDDDESTVKMFLECEVLEDERTDKRRRLERYGEMVDICMYHMGVEEAVDDAVESVCNTDTFKDRVETTAVTEDVLREFTQDVCKMIRDDDSFDVSK